MNRIILVLFVVYASVMTLPVNAMTEETPPPMESVDLSLATTMNATLTSFYRTAVLSSTWERAALNVTVLDHAGTLDQIGIQVVMNGLSTRASFSQYQKALGLSRPVIYQFAIPQVLVIPLNYTPQTFHEIEITFSLDYGIQVLAPNIELQVLKTELLGLHAVRPIVPEEIPVLAKQHSYLLPRESSSTSSLTRTQIIAPVLLPISLDPATEAFQCNITISLTGGQIRSVTIAGITHTSEIVQTSLNLEAVLVFAAEVPLYPVDILILPELGSQEGLTTATLSVTIEGVVIPRIDFGLLPDLPPHPVPAPLSLLFWAVALFGVPLWYIYHENLADTPEEVEDGKTGQKI